jgi:hypothetical protein
LRQIFVDELISYDNKDNYNGELEKIVGRITQLLETSNESKGIVQEIMPEVFVGSISKSVKSGIRMR